MSIVFRNVSYIALTIGVAFITYALFALASIRSIVFSVDSATALHLIAVSFFDLPLADMAYAIVLSLLIGINASLLLFYLKRYGLHVEAGASAAALGTFTALLGFGCAACGTLFFTTLLTSVAGVGIATAIPIDGWIFQIAGIALLLFSIMKLARAITEPHVCAIE